MVKRLITGIALVVLLFGLMLATIGCQPVSRVEADAINFIVGWFSYPVIYVSDGANNFADPNNPATGTFVADATVTVSNETTGVSKEAVFVASQNYYTPLTELEHQAGESVSLIVETSTETVRGSATVTPDPTYSNLSPADNATVALPFVVSWEVTPGTYEATHSWLSILGATTAEADNYQVVVPITTTSVTITSDNISTGEGYYISVLGVNVMSLSGAKSGSVVYVGGGNTSDSISITVEAE